MGRATVVAPTRTSAPVCTIAPGSASSTAVTVSGSYSVVLITLPVFESTTTRPSASEATTRCAPGPIPAASSLTGLPTETRKRRRPSSAT